MFEMSLVDPWNDEVTFRKFKVVPEDVQTKASRLVFMAWILPVTNVLHGQKMPDHD